MAEKHHTRALRHVAGALALTLALALNGGAAQARDMGKWETFDSTDRITGKKTVGAILIARTTAHTRQRSRTDHSKDGQLLVACNAGRLAVIFGISDTLVADHAARVTYRFDERAPVVRRKWDRTIESDGAGVWGAKAVPLAHEILKSSSLIWRVENNVFGETEMSFDLAGAENALAEVRKACKI